MKDCDLEYPDVFEPETSTASPQHIFPEQRWGDTETLGSQSPMEEWVCTEEGQNTDNRSGNPGSQDSHGKRSFRQLSVIGRANLKSHLRSCWDPGDSIW